MGLIRPGVVEIERSALHKLHPQRFPEPWAAFAAGLPYVAHGFTRDEAQRKLLDILARQRTEEH